MRTATDARRTRTVARTSDTEGTRQRTSPRTRGSERTAPRETTPPPPPVRTGPTSISRAWEARGSTDGLDPAHVALTREVFVADVAARLVQSGLLPAGTKLDSPLAAGVAARLLAAPALVSSAPTTFGAMLSALVVDVDGDHRFDVDALALERALPGVGTSQLLDALGAKLDEGDRRELLEKVGFDVTKLDQVTQAAALELVPPTDLGLSGENDLDRWRQQLALRADALLTDDGTRPGELDPGDHVELVNATTGQPLAVAVGSIPGQLLEAFRYNLLTARAAETYSASASQIQFIDPVKGDAVNTDFWTVSSAPTPAGRQTSWELRADKTPAAGIDDCFGPHASDYSTECAHGRTLVRLKGLLDYDRAVQGSDAAGDFAFSARFASTPNGRAEAESYLAGFEAARKNGTSWAEYSATHQPPKIEYALEISRHWILGAGERSNEPFTQFGGGAAAGTSGYFHNYGVSISGVEAGWVGENVIDVGYRDGVHRWYGHPLGIHTQTQLEDALATAQVKSMSELADYLVPRITEAAWKELRPTIERVEKRLADLKRRDPDDEDAILAVRRELAALHVGHAVRSVIADELTASGSTTAPALLAAVSARPDDPAVYTRLLGALKGPGVARLARAFTRIDADTRDAAADTLGFSASPTKEEQAAIVLRQGLAPDGRPKAALISELRGLAARRREVADLELGGRLGSRKDLQAWLRSDAFTTWYRAETGGDYQGSRSVSELSLEQLAALVERVLPGTRGRLTIHAETNGGDELLTHQMAELLKTGHVEKAKYSPEPSVAPR